MQKGRRKAPFLHSGTLSRSYPFTLANCSMKSTSVFT